MSIIYMCVSLLVYTLYVHVSYVPVCVMLKSPYFTLTPLMFLVYSKMYQFGPISHMFLITNHPYPVPDKRDAQSMLIQAKSEKSILNLKK